MCDFEIAISNAFEKEFEGVEVSGCYWHFSNAHQSWIQGTYYLGWSINRNGPNQLNRDLKLV